MNEQQLQQILTIQQAIAAAATAAVINSLLNPQQQAAGLGQPNANALSDQPNNDLQQHQHLLQQLQQLQQDSQRRDSPATTTSPTATSECNTRIQDLLVQLQQQASMGPAGPMALNLNLGAGQNLHAQSATSNASSLGSPIRSPVGRLGGQELNTVPTTSNTQSSNQASPIKKLKTRHNHQPQSTHHQSQQQSYQNRSSEATSKPQHSTPKNYSTSISNLNSGRSNNSSNQNTSSSFLSNNVGLPRKLVRGQDVWLGRGAEQTRQILKCMWCGQSFRTLADMTQHMKITQHYTNIISQEQITSWRQPESSEANSKHGISKQNAHIRNLDDNLDDHSSGKFDDSDRDDSFSNDDDLDQQHKHRSASNQSNNSINHRLDNNVKSESTPDNRESASESNHGDSPRRHVKGTTKSSAKPLTRSKKRENETLPNRRDAGERGRENSPATSTSSQQRQSSASNLILGDLNEDSETNKEDGKTNGRESQDINRTVGKTSSIKDELDNIEDDPRDETEEQLKHNAIDITIDDHEKEVKLDDIPTKADSSNDGVGRLGSTSPEINDQRDSTTQGDHDDSKFKDVEAETAVTNDDDNFINEHDNVDEQASETNESAATTTTASVAISAVGGQRGETGDPLSALETMVEKSFDPRMRPGVANGGILQRLGIDEEVCPPWQQLNYANWYAAAAYHPMAAAALLAAGINLQNGIKLSKNVAPKKNED